MTREPPSFAIIDTQTGDCVLEMFKDDKRLPYLKERFKKVPIREYLAGLNEKSPDT